MQRQGLWSNSACSICSSWTSRRAARCVVSTRVFQNLLPINHTIIPHCITETYFADLPTMYQFFLQEVSRPRATKREIDNNIFFKASSALLSLRYTRSVSRIVPIAIHPLCKRLHCVHIVQKFLETFQKKNCHFAQSSP